MIGIQGSRHSTTQSFTESIEISHKIVLICNLSMSVEARFLATERKSYIST